ARNVFEGLLGYHCTAFAVHPLDGDHGLPSECDGLQIFCAAWSLPGQEESDIVREEQESDGQHGHDPQHHLIEGQHVEPAWLGRAGWWAAALRGRAAGVSRYRSAWPIGEVERRRQEPERD